MRRGFQRERFTSALAESDMTLQDIARLSEVATVTINKWINHNGHPDIERLRRVAATLAVPLAELIFVPDDACFPSDLRLRAGMTQVQLAAAAGLTTTGLCAFERAELHWNPRRAAVVADAVGVSFEQMEAAWWRARKRPAGTPP